MATLEELETLYRERYGVFLRVAAAVAGDAQAARDAVHDAFVRAVDHRARCRGAAEPWVWRIVVNEARKRRARDRRHEHVPAALAQTAATNGHDEEGAIRALLAALPERQRLTLFLRYYADLDYDAIARALSVSPGTVGAALNAAHATLRERLKEER